MQRDREFAKLVAIELQAEGKAKGILQKDIADAAGIGKVQFSYYIRGTRGSMTVATLVKAAERLGVSPQVIVARAYAKLGPRQDAPGAEPLD